MHALPPATTCINIVISILIIINNNNNIRQSTLVIMMFSRTTTTRALGTHSIAGKLWSLIPRSAHHEASCESAIWRHTLLSNQSVLLVRCDCLACTHTHVQ